MSEKLKGELASLRLERDRAERPRRRWPLLLLLPAILLLGGLYALRAQQALSAPMVRVAQATTLTSDEAPAGAPILTASGYVVARRDAVVSAKIQGRLAELRVEEGSQVAKNEVIARLEDVEYRAQVARAVAQVARAEADLAEQERQLRLARQLTEEQVLAADDLEAAESRVRIAGAALQQAQADVAFAQAQLENTVIRSPFAGVVLKKMAEVGESVAPIPPGVNISTSSGAIVALADLATLEMEADVAEANVARLSAGQPAEVTVEAFPDRRFAAQLRQVIPTADRTKATVQVKVTILEKDPFLKPEMSAKVTFMEPEPEPSGATAADAPPEQVVVAPRAAIVRRDGEDVVFTVEQGKVGLRRVTTAGERDGQVVIRDGLYGGERLVLSPPDDLADGDEVRVQG